MRCVEFEEVQFDSPGFSVWVSGGKVIVIKKKKKGRGGTHVDMWTCVCQEGVDEIPAS